MSKVRLVNAINNPNADIGLVEKGKFLTYLFVTNLRYDNPEADNISHILDDTEDMITIGDVNRVLYTLEDTAPTEEVKYKSEFLDKTSILAVRVDEEFLETDLTAINPEAKLVKADPNKPIYIYYYVADVDTEYAVSRLNFNSDFTAIDNLAVIRKPVLEVNVDDFADLPVVYTGFLDTYKKIYNLPPVAESQSNYLLVVDGFDIDSIIAMSMFRNALQAMGLNMMLLKDYLKVADKSEFNAIIFKGLETVIEEDIAGPSVILTPREGISLTSTIIEFADKIINSNGNAGAKPKTIIYLSNVLNRLVDVDAARFDTEILALKNGLLHSGPNGLVSIINNFISNMTAETVEDGLITVFFTESLGKFYSQAVRYTDGVHYNTNSAVSSKVSFTGDDTIEVVEMKVAEYEEESIEEYLRANNDREYIIVSSLLNSEFRELKYTIIGSNIDEVKMAKIAQLVKGRVLRGQAIDSSIVVKEASITSKERTAYRFDIKLDDLFTL